MAALAATVAAQPQVPPLPATQPVGPGQAVLSDSAVQEARRAYDEGSAHYVAGRYQEALIAFERAYTLRPNPVVLLLPPAPLLELPPQAAMETIAAAKAADARRRVVIGAPWNGFSSGDSAT